MFLLVKKAMFLTSIKTRILAIILSMGVVSVVGFEQLFVLDNQYHTVMLCFMLNIVLAVLLSIILFKRILYPIRQLMGMAEDFKDGTLHERIEFDEKDELSLLGKSFVDMADEVELLHTDMRDRDALNRVYTSTVVMLSASDDQEMALAEVLATISMHIPVSASAVCLYAHANEKLCLAAVHAMSDEEEIQSDFLTYVLEELQLLSDTMSMKYLIDSEFFLDGETESSQPKYTAMLPVLYRQERQGVLVLALERELNTTQLDFLHKLVGDMGIFLKDIERYKHLEMLNIELEKHRKQLQQERDAAVEDSITDSLTRIYNRGYFDLSCKGFLQHARRNHEPLSLLLIDIDFFKAVNDTFGHPCGDAVLIRVAQVMKNALRETDFVARYGGEEFICVLPHANMLQAHQAAEKLRFAVASELFDEMDGKSVTVSIGLSALKDNDSDLQAMVERADKSLYRAKETGRNRIVCDDELDKHSA